MLDELGLTERFLREPGTRGWTWMTDEQLEGEEEEEEEGMDGGDEGGTYVRGTVLVIKGLKSAPPDSWLQPCTLHARATPHD